MTLWTLNLFLPGAPTPIRMVFKDENRAKQALNTPPDLTGRFVLSDDFGVEINLHQAPAARVLCNVIEELEANIELTLLQHRASMKANKRAASDPTLSNGGSSIIAPGQGGPVVPFPRGSA